MARAVPRDRSSALARAEWNWEVHHSTISHLTGNPDVSANNSCADDTAGCVISSVNPPKALAFPSTPGAGSSHAGVGRGCVVRAAFHGFRSTTGTSAEHLEPLGWAWWHQTGLCRAQSSLVPLLCHCGVTGTNCH